MPDLRPARNLLRTARAIVAVLIFLGTVRTNAQPNVPSWARGAVWYQIFPERFRNGDPANDPTSEDLELPPEREWHISPWTSDWYALQPWESRHSPQFYANVFERRYGGDLQGVIDELDYIRSLGATAIYFNPVFESISLHKYDATSYHHIDHTFGPGARGDLRLTANETDDPATWHWSAADSLFLRLIREAHRRHLRVVIDGVFNHCGTRFFAFQDLIDHQESSRYAAWYQVERWDDRRTPYDEFAYKGWWGNASMPQFNRNDTTLVLPVRNYLFAVTRKWMDPNGDGDPSDGVDGWRLDVANEVPSGFWREWRGLVRHINPEAIIIGEIWNDAARWLRGDQFDAVMNYPFARACVRFFIDSKKTHLTPSGFDAELATIRRSYPEGVQDVLQNLLDSHDTDRLLSMIMNPDRPFDGQNGLRNNPAYDISAPNSSAKRVHRLITLFQMTYVGAPMVYHGDEAGMWGADDPDDRKPMVWPDLRYDHERSHPVAGRRRNDDTVGFDRDIFTWYQKLITIHTTHPALQLGTYRTLLADDAANVFSFERTSGTERIVTVLNAGTTTQRVRLPISGLFTDLLTEQSYQTGGEPLAITAQSGMILLQRSE